MVSVRVEKLTKRYGDVYAVKDVDLEVKDGEIFAVLGPSGCGKTTLLRLVAGLEEPTYGRIYFDGRDVTNLPTQKRNTALVPQTWALWPHMTVFENVAYGLKLRKIDRREIERRVKSILELVGLSGLERRRPYELSGGQQQRVALARALVVEPSVLLLDEPLANLDAKLRVELRAEVRRIAKELRITTIYVTHDQEEAFSVADRIAVMYAGSIKQIGTAEELFYKPVDLFVASFIGKSVVVRGKVVDKTGDLAVLDVGFPLRGVAVSDLSIGEEAAAVIRTRGIKVSGDEGGIPCTVEDSRFVGGAYVLALNCGGVKLEAEAAAPRRAGEVVKVKLEGVLIYRP
ncbi:MAG: ABC transporter ATP-binding protein [Thermoproteus sp.]